MGWKKKKKKKKKKQQKKKKKKKGLFSRDVDQDCCSSLVRPSYGTCH
jgi:hypothetical protein